MFGRCLVLQAASLAVLALTAAGVEARESKEEWQARVKALERKLEAKKQAYRSAVAAEDRARTAIRNHSTFGNPYSTDPNYQQWYQRELANLEAKLKDAQDAVNRANDEVKEAFREWERALNAMPR